jgi:hypothetical protein
MILPSDEVMMLELDTIRFVVGADGQPSAVQVDIGLWQKIIEALEDVEDIEIAREALAELNAVGGEAAKAGWVDLEDVIEQWQRDDAVKLRD